MAGELELNVANENNINASGTEGRDDEDVWGGGERAGIFESDDSTSFDIVSNFKETESTSVKKSECEEVGFIKAVAADKVGTDAGR